MLPPWMPTVGLEGGRINIVPVDFVVAAWTTSRTQKARTASASTSSIRGLPRRRRARHLRKAAHAPEDEPVRINAALLGFIPKSVKKALMALAPVRRIRNAVMKDLGLPDDILDLRQLPDALRLPRDAARCSRAAASPCPARRLRLAPVGLLGAPPRPRPVHRPHPAGRSVARWCWSPAARRASAWRRPQVGRGRRRHRHLARDARQADEAVKEPRVRGRRPAPDHAMRSTSPTWPAAPLRQAAHAEEARRRRLPGQQRRPLDPPRPSRTQLRPLPRFRAHHGSSTTSAACA
jgi:hypothetical protein